MTASSPSDGPDWAARQPADARAATAVLDVPARSAGRDPAELTLTDGAVKNAYRRWAPIYDMIFGLPTHWGRVAATERANRIGGTILEAGVGTGLALPLYRRDSKVAGIDLSIPMLTRAADKVRRRKLANVQVLAGMDAGKLAFPSASFDVVVAMFVITVVPDPDAVMDELVRVTKPGGTIIFVNHFKSEGGAWAPIERAIAPISSTLGWNPTMPMSRIMGRRDLVLKERIKVAPLRLFTLLRFERV